jgi:hypothetical protein
MGRGPEHGAYLPLATSLGTLFKTGQAGLLASTGACAIMPQPLSDVCGGHGCQALRTCLLPSVVERDANAWAEWKKVMLTMSC